MMSWREKQLQPPAARLTNGTDACYAGARCCGFDCYKSCKQAVKNVISYNREIGICCWYADLQVAETS